MAGVARVRLAALDRQAQPCGSTGGNVVGGLVAANSSAPFPALSGHPDLGPFVTNTGTVTNSYWDPVTTDAATSAAGTTRTTQEFLVRFGLNDLAELPKPEDLDADLAATVEARELAAPTAAPPSIHLEPDAATETDVSEAGE